MSRWRDLLRPGGWIAGAAAALLTVALAAAQAPEPARPAPPAQEQAQPAPATPANPPFRPGLVDALGQMLQSGFGAWSDGLKSARDTLGTFGTGKPASGPPTAPAEPPNPPAAGPAGAPPRLPGGIVSGRQQCAMAPNGAPDCAAAAAAMCQAKGYATGSSVDFQTADKCSGRLLAAGPKLGEVTCRPEHFVTKALCQ